jgi:hypothetical protein
VHQLNTDVRLRAVTRIVHARFLATAILLRRFSPAVERRIISQWERVTFRIFGLGGADTRHKVGEYVRLGYDVITQKLSEEEIAAGLRALGEEYSIKQVLGNIDWNDRYSGWQEELRYLMFQYDEYLSRKAGSAINATEWNKIWAQDPSKSIKHIEPQSS